MGKTVEQLEKEAMELPRQEQLHLAEALMANVHSHPDAELEKIWLDEVERRWEAIKSGRTRTLPAGQVLKEIRAELNEKRRNRASGS